MIDVGEGEVEVKENWQLSAYGSEGIRRYKREAKSR
jgi:hypothetical protein